MKYVGDYRCWTVVCKVDNCRCLLFLDVVGPANDFKHGLLPPLTPFKISCPECKMLNSYFFRDVDEKVLKNPPMDYRCGEFLTAIRTASESKRDALRTAIDEGDASGIAAGDVFAQVRDALKVR